MTVPRSQEVERLQLRLRVLLAVGTVLVLAYGLVFFYLQVVSEERYRALSDNNRLRTLSLPAPRGLVLDRYGRVLASNRVSYTLLLDREGDRPLDEVLPEVSEVLGLDLETAQSRLARYRRRPSFEPAVLQEDVDLSRVAYFEARRLEYPEVRVEVDLRRTYHYGDLAAHLLGYLGEVTEDELGNGHGYRYGDIVGRSGAERAYEDELRGAAGERSVIVNSRGRVMYEVGEVQPAVQGQTLWLTIDRDLQAAVEEAFAGRAGAAVFLDPRDGEVLAMFSSPAFDPNLFARRFSDADWQMLVNAPRDPLHDRVLQSEISPGSAFKIVIAVAGLAEGVITPQTTFHCSGSAVFHGQRRACWNRSGHGPVRLRDAIAHSCNVYFYNVGQRLGIERIARYARAFGLGRRTGIDLPREKAGLVPDEEWKQRRYGQPWYPGETISVAIGQGPLLSTPLQLATMVSAVANGGHLPTPHVVRGLQAAPTAPIDWRAPPGRRAVAGLAPEHLAEVRAGLRAVVARGTGRSARVPPYAVCGKTSSVQVFSRRSYAGLPVEQEDLPEHLRNHGFFVGFAPEEDARIAWAVFVEHGMSGGDSAAPLAREVLRRFFTLEEDRRGAPEVLDAGG